MTIWQSSLRQTALDKHQVHIWRANLDLPEIEVVRLKTFLSIDELHRASKFRFTEHRRRFVVARGILRELLGSYLDTSPKNVQFNYGDRGKPELLESNTPYPLHFNISHSQEYALFGFSTSNLIGVDIEHLREMPDAVKIAQRFFSHREFDLINNLGIKEQSSVFFKFWTAKEAYLKAIGTGLSGSLASIEIDLAKDSGNTLLFAINGNTRDKNNWSICSFVPAINYVGAMAIEAQITKEQIDFLSWN